mmetsp:Transcript_43783/g.126554  ORF Transcript_43783/g.126554 Transcript_43783/m.126554 type:complete len:202 (+) Transcript_43783:51-656(+)
MATIQHGSSSCDFATSSRCSQHGFVDAFAVRGSRMTCGTQKLTLAALTILPRTPSPTNDMVVLGRAHDTRLRTPRRTPPHSRSRCVASRYERTACGCSAWRTITYGRSPGSRCPSTSTASPSCTRRRSAASRCHHSRLSALVASTTTRWASTSRPSSASRLPSLLREPCSTLEWGATTVMKKPLRRRGIAGPWTFPARCSW